MIENLSAKIIIAHNLKDVLLKCNKLPKTYYAEELAILKAVFAPVEEFENKYDPIDNERIKFDKEKETEIIKFIKENKHVDYNVYFDEVNNSLLMIVCNKYIENIALELLKVHTINYNHVNDWGDTALIGM